MNIIRKNAPLLIQRSCYSRQIYSSATVPHIKYSHKYDYICPNQQLHRLKYSTHTIEQEEKDGFLKNLRKKFGWADDSKTRLRISSYMLYQSVADTINYKDLFEKFNLPNTFNSWFLVTELHVWMLLTRAMAEGSENGEDGRFMRNCIVEAMWADVNTRAKKLGAANPGGIRTQIQALSQQFQAALIAYDEGIMSDDKVLAGALWRRFFEMECDNYEQLEELVKYVRKHVLLLDSLSHKDFTVKPKFTWMPPFQE